MRFWPVHAIVSLTPDGGKAIVALREGKNDYHPPTTCPRLRDRMG